MKGFTTMTEIKAKQVVKALLEAGFHETRIRGDHHRYRDDHGHRVTVNYANLGDTIKAGTFASIKRQAGLK